MSYPKYFNLSTRFFHINMLFAKFPFNIKNITISAGDYYRSS